MNEVLQLVQECRDEIDRATLCTMEYSYFHGRMNILEKWIRNPPSAEYERKVRHRCRIIKKVINANTFTLAQKNLLFAHIDQIGLYIIQAAGS